MQTYTPSDPEFSNSISVVESTDPVSANNANAAVKQLIENDVVLKESVDLLLENSTKVGDVSGASVVSVAGSKSVTIKWSDPSDTVVDGVTIAKWKGTILVKKAGSAPTSKDDGTQLVNNTVRNSYSSTGYVDNNVNYGTTYYYRFFPYTTLGAVTEGTAASVTPAREILTLPSPSATLTYNTSEQTMTFSNYDPAKMTGTGMSATDAGDHAASFTPGADYMWSDNSQTAKSVTWSIAKASGSATVSTSSVELDADNLTATVTVSNATGTIGTPTTSDSSIATVSKSGSTITITATEATGTATITIPINASTNYNATSKTVSVNATFSSIWGAEWDGTSTTAWSRTDAAETFTDPQPAVNNGNGSSPFDSCMPWAGMERVTDSEAGTLVKIPKYWYKWTRTGTKMKLQISDGEQDGFLVSPAHADRGDGSGERDYVYVGAYHCATSTYKSTTGVKPANNYTRAQFRTSIHNLGSKVWQYDYAMYWTIMMLYLVEYADWNTQAKIGYGCGNNSAAENAGLCDGMTYHTGTNAANRTTYGHTRYRYIEDLWGNVYDWCDGIYFSSANIYCIKNPANFSDTSGGTNVGARDTSGGWISKWTEPTASGFEYALYQASGGTAGSDSTYVCDYCYYGSSGVVLYVGGYYYQYQSHGGFYLYGDNAASYKYTNIGSRLQKLP